MYHGKLVRLRRLHLADIPDILPHWNDYGLRQFLQTPLPTSFDDFADYINKTDVEFAERKAFTFGIETLDSNLLVGIISLENISWIGHNAEISTLAIFDPKERNKGYGSDAMLTLVDVAFSVLNFNSIFLRVAAINTNALHLYENLGFKIQGRIREMAYRNGARYDVVILDILRSEFVKIHGILPKDGAVALEE